MVDRLRVGLEEVLASELEDGHAELLGHRIEVALQRVARLGSPVAALGPARRLVGEDPHTLPAVRRQVLAYGLQRARVVQRRRAVTGVRTAVDEGLEVHAGQPAGARP